MDLIEHFKNARTLVSLQAGIVLFNEGELGKNMYVLMRGTAAICVGGEVIELAGPGSLLGEMALIHSAIRSATVITRSDCKVISINGAQFDLLVRESPEFARHVMTVIADRLRRMNQRFVEMMLSDRSGRAKSSTWSESLASFQAKRGPGPDAHGGGQPGA